MKYYLFLFLGLLSNSLIAQSIYELDAEIRDNSVVITRTVQDMISRQNYGKATELLEVVMEKDPTFHPAYVNYYNSARNIPSKIPDLISKLKEAQQIFVEDDELAYYLGNILQSEKRYQEAIKAYTEAINYSKINGEDFPIVWAYHFNRGNCFLKTNQHDKAIPDYSYALQLSPDNPDILTNRGFCYYKTNRRSDACKDWSDSKKFGSKDTDKYIRSLCR